MTFNEVISEACKQPSLDDAIAYYCIWESERVIKHVSQNPNEPWETCFKYGISLVRKQYLGIY